jgi:regulator of protease activity HflC (stomatin/prohibitin superfamily)/membrane protein implicated in regulation of membrane protease activity
VAPDDEGPEQEDVEAPAGDAMTEKVVNDTVSWARSIAELRDRNAEMWWGERLLAMIANPNVAFLLLLFGFYGVVHELSSPGFGVPGVLGVLCLLLGMFGLAMLPVSYLGIGLLLLGFGLLIAEAFVTSFGLLGVGGAVCLLLGGLMLVDSPAGFLRVSLTVAAPAAAAVSLITVVLVTSVVRAHKRPATGGSEGLLSDRARALEAFTGEAGAFAGHVLVHGERWRARSAVPIAPGTSCEVRGREGLVLLVEPGSPPRDSARPGLAGRSAVMFEALGTFLALAVLYFLTCLRILFEYQRGVVFRLGRVLGEPKGPGLILVFWPIDRLVRMSLRTIVVDVPPQDVITRDNVSVQVNAVVYYRVIDPLRAVLEVEDFMYATHQVSQTSLRSIVGQAQLDELLAERDKINSKLQEVIDTQTDPWGIKVSLVEVKHVDLPQSMQRAMARQAESERERRAKVIHAMGELEAAEKLHDAAEKIDDQPKAMLMRFLQTLTDVGAENNSTIVFPIPIDLFEPMLRRGDEPPKKAPSKRTKASRTG